MQSTALDTITQQQAWLKLQMRAPVPVFKTPQEATVQSSTDSTVTVVLNLEGWGATTFTCPYQSVPGASPSKPPAGATCLVHFVGYGLDKPYATLFVGWP